MVLPQMLFDDMTCWMVAGLASHSCMRRGRAEVLPVRCCTQGKPTGRRCTCCKGQAWGIRTGGSCHAAWAGEAVVSDSGCSSCTAQ